MPGLEFIDTELIFVVQYKRQSLTPVVPDIVKTIIQSVRTCYSANNIANVILVYLYMTITRISSSLCEMGTIYHLYPPQGYLSSLSVINAYIITLKRFHEGGLPFYSIDNTSLLSLDKGITQQGLNTE